MDNRLNLHDGPGRFLLIPIVLGISACAVSGGRAPPVTVLANQPNVVSSWNDIAKGEALVKTGGADTMMACATSYGTDLKGVGPIPGIAGRWPSSIVRQLYDIQQGTRAGALRVLMKPTVEKLTGDGMNAIAAYLATQLP